MIKRKSYVSINFQFTFTFPELVAVMAKYVHAESIKNQPSGIVFTLNTIVRQVEAKHIERYLWYVALTEGLESLQHYKFEGFDSGKIDEVRKACEEQVRLLYSELE